MEILFITLAKIDSINDSAIYPDLLRKFKNEGHNVYIVTPCERRYKISTFLKEEENSKLLKVWTPNLLKTNIAEKGFGFLIVEILFKKAIEKYFSYTKFDLILYSTPPITFNSLIKELKNAHKAKTYLLLKDIFPQNAVDLKMFNKKSLIYKYFRNQEKKLYKISDKIGCMSDYNKKYILTNNPDLSEDKVEINPNSISLESYNYQSNTTIKIIDNLPKDKLILIYGGNLGKPQGIDFLLDVIDDLKNNSDIFFIIVGSGTESNRIIKWFKENDPNNALLIDHLPQPDYNLLLTRCHVGLVFLNPLFTIPNYPSRILSYMYNKLPILFGVDKNTDVGTDAELGKYGLSCINGDLVTFKKNISLLENDPKLRNEMGSNGYERLKKDFNVDYSYKIIVDHFK
jgi:glycosyltransferase involved in cell wall biosynthesis